MKSQAQTRTANKSNEEAFQELDVEEIQEPAEGAVVQESVEGGVEEATKQALGDEEVKLS